MYLRAGFLSLGLLLISRVLGLARESVQAAAFGSTGMGDVVIVMFTLPDLLVGIFLSGALSYVLLPHWAQQSLAEKNASQKKVAYVLVGAGVLLGFVIMLSRGLLGQALAPGLTGSMQTLGASSLVWSAAVLPLAMLAGLWATRLQHEHDFVGMYAGNLWVNLVLVAALLLVAASYLSAGTTTGLGLFLVLAMLVRLGWLGWCLRNRYGQAVHTLAPGELTCLSSVPRANIWIWAGLSSGLLLLLPLVGRSIASQSGEGALASFNYAWKLVELPLVLAVQLVASLAFPAITRTEAGSRARQQALEVAFLLAWTLACAAVAVVATFSHPLANVLFGWGRMSADKLDVIARWSAVGVWSLLPQALIAVLLTVMAISKRMHVAVWVYAAGLAALLVFGWARGGSGVGLAQPTGAAVMWMLNAVLAVVAVALMLSERSSLRCAFPWVSCLLPLLLCIALVCLKPLFANLSFPLTIIMCLVYSLLVVGGAVLANPLLRGLLLRALYPVRAGIAPPV